MSENESKHRHIPDKKEHLLHMFNAPLLILRTNNEIKHSCNSHYGYKASLQQHFAVKGCLTSRANGEKFSDNSICTNYTLQNAVSSETVFSSGKTSASSVNYRGRPN